MYFTKFRLMVEKNFFFFFRENFCRICYVIFGLLDPIIYKIMPKNHAFKMLQKCVKNLQIYFSQQKKINHQGKIKHDNEQSFVLYCFDWDQTMLK